MGATHADVVEAWIRQLTVAQKVGQLLVPYVSGSHADRPHPENLRRFGVATPSEAVRRLDLGGVIYFGWNDNVEGPQQIGALSNGLQRASAVPLTIGIDQETGSVARISTALTQFPGAMALGASRDPGLTFEAYAIVAQELRAIGVNCDYAPVADVNVNPANPVIGVRAFSSNPDLVAEHVAAAVRGLQTSGVSATAKHFPGHGDTSSDSHFSLPLITHNRPEWDSVDAPPFRAAIEAGCDSIMTGHLSFPELEPTQEPASLSHRITTGLLREELGFTGVIVTDSLRMAGVRTRHDDGEIAVRALEAGADLLLDPELPLTAYRSVMDAIESGRLAEQRIDDSVRRVLSMKAARGLFAGPLVDESAISSQVRTSAHLSRAAAITDQTTTLVVDEGRLIPLPPGSLLVTGWGETAVAQLARRLSRGGRVTTGHPVGPSPDAAAIAAAIGQSRRHDLILITTIAAWKDPGQRPLVHELLQTGKPLVVAALRDAYDLTALSSDSGMGVTTFLATYSDTDVALESLARVLEGTISPRGRLPVDLAL